MTNCKFLKEETVQGILHEYCQNETMWKINKEPPDKLVHCIGRPKCVIAVNNDSANNSEHKKP